MVYDSLKSEFVELLSASFKPEEINEIGRFFDKNYDHHKLSDTERHVTISSRKAALILCDFMAEERSGGIMRLVQFVIGLDGKLFQSRLVEISRLESFLSSLVRMGSYFDFKSGKIIQSRKELDQLVNWGALKDDRTYEVTVMSLDITRSSELVRTYGLRVMEKVYFKFMGFLNQLLNQYDGRIWHWAGDGGIVAFTFKGHVTRAVLCAIDIQRSLMVFHLSPDYPLKDDFSLRIGLDTGRIKFNHETGKIVSDVINYSAHLEKMWAKPGRVAVSSAVFEALPPRVAGIFLDKGLFEGRTCYSVAQSLDTITTNQTPAQSTSS